MARKKDLTSVRQRGIMYVDEHSGTLTRQQILAGLLVAFNISLSYAKTIYNEWRKEQKASGVLTAVFVIRDYKDGETVEPYVVKKHVDVVQCNHHISIKDAQHAYKLELQERLKLSNRLK